MNYLVARCQAVWATRDQGATAVEYGLMVGLIAMAILASVTLLGTKLTDLFSAFAGKVSSATPA